MCIFDLIGKNVMITGASSGIGYSCAVQMAKIGANLILAARRKDRIDELAAHCQSKFGIKTHTIELDVTDHSAVVIAIKNIPKELSSIDVLINNAGLAAGADAFQDATLTDWEQMIDTNVKGLLYVTKALIPGMLKRNLGHIINIGSIAGREVYRSLKSVYI